MAVYVLTYIEKSTKHFRYLYKKEKTWTNKLWTVLHALMLYIIYANVFCFNTQPCQHKISSLLNEIKQRDKSHSYTLCYSLQNTYDKGVGLTLLKWTINTNNTRGLLRILANLHDEYDMLLLLLQIMTRVRITIMPPR